MSSSFHESDCKSFQAETYFDVANKLASEVHNLKSKNDKLEEHLNLTIEEKDELNVSIEKTENSLADNKRNLKRTANRENYWREKCLKIVNDNNEKIYSEEEFQTLHSKISVMEIDRKQLNNQIAELQNHKFILEEQLAHQQKINEALFYDECSKTYSTDLHQCVYSLLDNNVAYEKSNAVITAVCRLVNLKPNKLPSVSTIHNWSVERGLISKLHVAESSTSVNTTLHTDEASKYGHKWGAFATRDSDGKYLLLGMKDMATKSSFDTLDTFKDILNDIDDCSSTNAGKEVLSNI